jgi:hypothetical protein
LEKIWSHQALNPVNWPTVGGSSSGFGAALLKKRVV